MTGEFVNKGESQSIINNFIAFSKSRILLEGQ